MGNLLNAQLIVVGSYTVFRDTLQINAKVLSVETGEIIEQTSIAGRIDKFLHSPEPDFNKYSYKNGY
jgi:hypothetical protein